VLYELDAIASSEPDIRSATSDRGGMIIHGGAGTLRVAYANLTIELAGTPIGLAELARVTRNS
jgi:hypothetical protein